MSGKAVEIKDLKLNYGKVTALENINADFEEGSFIAIVGPNGSGKTSLIKILLGLIKPNKGTVKILSESPGKAPSGKIGYVPQVKTLDTSFPARSIDLVVSGLINSWPARIRKETRQKALEALDYTSSTHLAERQLRELSGGELQKVYLSRSLVRKPKILLLDEPESGIDMICEKVINKTITEFNKNYNTTVIMVTHNWATARHHSEMTLLLNKRQVMFGRSYSVLEEKNLRQAFIHIGYGKHDDHRNDDYRNHIMGDRHD